MCTPVETVRCTSLGIEHGYSAGIWAFAVFFLVANEMSITAGYHRLWAHRAYEAHPALRVLYLVFGTMALAEQCLGVVQRPSPPPSACG
ncbi:MAG: hypothetical protein WDM77_08760 [Steroidobacteraceae bacterium]